MSFFVRRIYFSLVCRCRKSEKHGLSEKMFELRSGFMLKADGIAIRLQWLQRVERLSEEKVLLYVLCCDAGI